MRSRDLALFKLGYPCLLPGKACPLCRARELVLAEARIRTKLADARSNERVEFSHPARVAEATIVDKWRRSWFAWVHITTYADKGAP